MRERTVDTGPRVHTPVLGLGSEMTGMKDQHVIVVGAGAAGLVSAAELRRRGLPALVIERADAIGASWRERYDRLRLNSSRPFSKLPGQRFARGTGIFPARYDVVRYLERYAQDNSLEVRVGMELERIERDGGEWVLRTSSGDLRAEQVIVASGYAHTQYIPDWPGRDRFGGSLIHSGAYKNSDPYRGSDVLVAGAGCSGMEIAYDVLAGGARRVRMAVRTPPNMMRRAPLAPLFARLLVKLPPERADRILWKVRLREFGDLSAYGLPIPEEGVISRLRRLGVAPSIVDKEVVEAIKARRIEIVAGVDSLDETGVELADGSRLEPDAVIAATGYRTGLEPVAGHLDVLNERGVPRARGGAAAAPGLRFIGYIPRPAQLGTLGDEAKRAATEIVSERSPKGSRTGGLRPPWTSPVHARS
ncbi:MAG TPA: NAD(P)/FAD-dependent oxidoreductase [Thermoleophilaceae bacterium]|nr:NAD(P)/FAD-dependent oxidoreductase [Thermoleophilaceae bacterium]